MRKPIEGVDFFVRVVDFPIGSGCDGAVTPNSDDTYSVYLDARTTRERQKTACDHERSHIWNNDFCNGEDIRKVEGL